MKYIDADRFRSEMWYMFGEQDDYFNKVMAKWDSGLWVRYKAVEEVIDAQPTIEAEPVKHGRWKVLASGNDAICTNCEHYWIPNGDQYDYHYCPHCGAKMDL